MLVRDPGDSERADDSYLLYYDFHMYIHALVTHSIENMRLPVYYIDRYRSSYRNISYETTIIIQ